VNEEQYQALCKACDELLQAADSTVERVATPWLHVIRAHPVFLENYADIFSLEATSGWGRWARNIASALRHLGKAFISGGEHWSSVGELPQKCDVLIVSHLVNDSFPGQEGDFYYGRVASEVAEQGLSATIALINYTGKTPANLARNWRQAKMPRVIFAPVLSFSSEWALYRRALAEACRLKAGAEKQADQLNRRVAQHASLEVASGSAVSASRLGEQIKALVARLQPRAIVVTYEGHSWERIAFSAARAVSPSICCIGYQHAVLFNLQHAVQRKLAAKYNPDVILTSGPVSRAKLQKNQDLKDVRIETLGSNRSFARKAAHAGRTALEKKRVCLVLPEGIVSECSLLFGFSLECAWAMPSMEFIWRLHPNMNYAVLTQQNPAFRDLPSNITLSADTLAEDIAHSHWALYRSSTAIVQAAVSGVRPVYLHRAGEIPIDTLYEIAELHAQVVKPEDFKRLVMEAGDTDTVAEQVQDYCEQMFTPIDTGKLVACIRDPIKSERDL
jgi:hypothetical protein